MERGLIGYLGLGSNQGDRLANLRAARDALGGHGVEVLASSSVYETAPQGEVTDQLPHPEVTSRRFVLEPLLDIEPDLALPDGTRLADELDGVRDQPVRPAGAL